MANLSIANHYWLYMKVTSGKKGELSMGAMVQCLLYSAI